MATAEEINQYRLMPEDVLMTEGGDPDKLGRGAIIHEPPKDCIHQNHIFRVVGRDKPRSRRAPQPSARRRMPPP